MGLYVWAVARLVAAVPSLVARWWRGEGRPVVVEPLLGRTRPRHGAHRSSRPDLIPLRLLVADAQPALYVLPLAALIAEIRSDVARFGLAPTPALAAADTAAFDALTEEIR